MGKRVISAYWYGNFYDVYNNGGRPFSMWVTSGPWEPWEPYGVTFNTRPNHRPDRIVVAAAPGWNGWDLTSWVQNWVGGCGPNFGLTFDTAGDTQALYTFGADEMSCCGTDSYIAVTHNVLPTVRRPRRPTPGPRSSPRRRPCGGRSPPTGTAPRWPVGSASAPARRPRPASW